jgi:DNA (cytosine-5)-methyltransferase 1
MVVRPESYASFFAGIGALDDAIGRALPGSRCCVYVENEITAVATLAARMEAGTLDPAPIWSDARTFPAGQFRGRVDLVVGGFPCQDISLAGRGDGIHGRKSALFFALADAVRDLRPRYVFLENTAALTLRGLDAVLGTLATLGLDAEWGCLRASDVGAPHRRDRWWCLAWNRERAGVGQADPGGRRRQRSQEQDLRATDRLAAPRRDHPDRRGAPLGDAERRERERRRDASDVASTAGRARPEGLQRERGGRAAGDPEPGGDGSALANGQSRGRRVRGQPPGPAGLADGHGQDLGDARRRGRSRSESEVAGVSGSTRGARRPQTADAAGSGARGNEEAVGDAAPERQALWRGVGRGVRVEQSAPDGAGDPLGGLPEWPPLPDDVVGWRAVLARYPHLAPALVRPQPGIRRVADVRAGWDWTDVPWAPCDCHRGDRLRGLGNSVCPAQAAAALRVLWWRAFGEWLEGEHDHGNQ